MSTSRSDAVPSPSSPDVTRLPNPSWNASFHAVEGTPYLIRTVRQQDLAPLSDVLASSFHAQEGWMRWLYPLLKAGIYEDLRSRMLTRGPYYACLAAVRTTVPGQPTSAELVGQSPHTALSLINSRDDAILGTIEIALKPPPLLQLWSGKYLYISNLAIKIDYRRRGIAQQLLSTCEQVAMDWGFRDLYLHVLENNHQARRLYWKAGYRLQRIDVNPFSLMLGQPRQLLLRKRLNSSSD